MIPLRWISYLALSFMGCSRPIHVPVSPISSMLSSQYNATAMLNDATWFGSAFAQREYVVNGKPCTMDRFSLGISTDLPHPNSGPEPAGGVTGCIGRCIPTQILGFQKIPLKIGRYKLSELQNCIESNVLTAGEYLLLVGGDGIINTYYPLGVTIWQGQKLVTIPGSDDSWVAVTRYDKDIDQVEGSFEVRLKSLQNEEVHFTKGSFKIKLTPMIFYK